MAKILHTSDFHLVDQGDNRWNALQETIALASRESVDFLVISGDLFNSDTDAESLRPAIRNLFEEAKCKTLIIPGNHDQHSFSTGLYFGEGVRVLAKPEWSKNVYTSEGLQFIGIPFAPINAQEFRQKLWRARTLLDTTKTSILIYHGELLDVSFDRDAFGSETGRYMPSRLSFFEELGVDYVLAGHFHTTFNVRQFGKNGFFVYPGSPVSITRREVGKRKVALIETGHEPRQIILDTHHYHRIELLLDAFNPEKPLDAVKKQLTAIDPNATVLLKVDGTIQGSEEKLAEAIKQEIGEMKVEPPEFLFRDISRIMAHPVFTLFETRLTILLESEEIDFEEAEGLREIVIQAMADVEL